MEIDRTAVLITCHNRRAKTLRSLEALFQDVPSDVSLTVYLVDDGSTDGTAEAVRATYPETRVLRGDGSLFWNGGMRLAFAKAMELDHDYYLWLNDDTLLEPGALSNLLATHRRLSERGDPDAIVIGSTREPSSDAFTYGGLVRASRWLPLSLNRVEPAEEPQRCDTMNGNCVLVPRSVAEKVGNLSDAFTHRMGDVDYGLRAQEKGCSVWTAPGYIGYCSYDHLSLYGTWLDADLSLCERLKQVEQPKGIPAREYKTFTRRHGGPLWFVYWVYPYARLIGSSILKSKKTYRAGRP